MSTTQEETYPLLLLFLDDETTRGRRVQIEKGRHHGITSGASSVITEWPNNLAPCWVLSLLCGLFIFLFTLLALNAAMNHQRFDHHHQITNRCTITGLDYKRINNETVHLIHNSAIWTKHQITLLNVVLKNYNPKKVHLVLLGERKKQKKSNFENVVRKHSGVLIEWLNYTEIFTNSPLQTTWRNLNEKSKLFACRVMYLWQYGGISFDLLENWGNKTLENVIVLGLKAFRNLPKGTVTIDDKGWHMESGIGCHAFFGDLLMNLKKANNQDTVQSIIKKTLDVFCKKGNIESGYCSTVKT